MTEDKFKELIDKYGFKRYADIVDSNDGRAKFDNVEPSCTGFGYVYLWVEESNNDVKVVYVGKAGKSMEKRCDQHRGGFNGGSKTGERHSKNIVNGIKEGKKYHVYARKSEMREILGEKDISMCCIEEIALIKKLNPPWNSMK